MMFERLKDICYSTSENLAALARIAAPGDRHFFDGASFLGADLRNTDLSSFTMIGVELEGSIIDECTIISSKMIDYSKSIEPEIEKGGNKATYILRERVIPLAKELEEILKSIKLSKYIKEIENFVGDGRLGTRAYGSISVIPILIRQISKIERLSSVRSTSKTTRYALSRIEDIIEVVYRLADSYKIEIRDVIDDYVHFTVGKHRIDPDLFPLRHYQWENVLSNFYLHGNVNTVGRGKKAEASEVIIPLIINLFEVYERTHLKYELLTPKNMRINRNRILQYIS